MKEFFLILFFSKIVLLTPKPIDFLGDYVIELDSPISAITSGASIEIDVSSMITWGEDESILDFRERLNELFPKGKISAHLKNDANNEILLAYTGAHVVNKNKVVLSLYNDKGVPLDIDYNYLTIKSSIELENVLIYWKNHKK